MRVRVSGISTFRTIGLCKMAEIPLGVFRAPANPASMPPGVAFAPLTSAVIVYLLRVECRFCRSLSIFVNSPCSLPALQPVPRTRIHTSDRFSRFGSFLSSRSPASKPLADARGSVTSSGVRGSGCPRRAERRQGTVADLQKPKGEAADSVDIAQFTGFGETPLQVAVAPELGDQTFWRFHVVDASREFLTRMNPRRRPGPLLSREPRAKLLIPWRSQACHHRAEPNCVGF